MCSKSRHYTGGRDAISTIQVFERRDLPNGDFFGFGQEGVSRQNFGCKAYIYAYVPPYATLSGAKAELALSSLCRPAAGAETAL